ncbi:Ku protein [Streptomyces sioyaensis]|uniref:Non-homologous end joining protein Ku n=1 Tax=Streptomyces sioyaensis TaxID=67364 RepID=A0A4Q1R637_9ACTN|nr:Ku protein [Streptomyces sioyaensis]MBM4796053.1 Ku protein [Streptomyces sioyaensis]RXS68728.1 Ku protein [Streptomyces sioyaensis]
MVPAIARLHITFGLVSIPVSVHAATERQAVPLHQVHARDGARIRQRRICEAEGTEVPLDEVARGYEAPDGRTVVLSDSDLADLPLPSMRAIEVVGFLPAGDVDPIALDRPYYLGVEGAGTRPYRLLRDAMADSGLVGVARMALRGRERLVVLRVRDDVIVAQVLLWPDEIRAADGLVEPAPEPRRQELQMAQTLMQSLSEDFRLDDQRDHYREALDEVVTAKLAGQEPPHAPAARAGPVVDLMEMLQESVRAAQEARSTAQKTPKGPGPRRTG